MPLACPYYRVNSVQTEGRSPRSCQCDASCGLVLESGPGTAVRLLTRHSQRHVVCPRKGLPNKDRERAKWGPLNKGRARARRSLSNKGRQRAKRVCRIRTERGCLGRPLVLCCGHLESGPDKAAREGGNSSTRELGWRGLTRTLHGFRSSATAAATRQGGPY